MIRLVTACVLSALIAAPAFAQKAPPTKDPPRVVGPLEQQEVEASDKIIDACSEIYAIDDIEKLREATWRFQDDNMRTMSLADAAHTAAAEAYIEAFIVFRSARNGTFEAIMDFAASLKDVALYELAQQEAKAPLLDAEIAASIDAFAGAGVADILQNPAFVGVGLADAALEAARTNERAMKDELVLARQAVVAKEAELNVAGLIWTGIRSCAEEQHGYLEAKAANTPAPADQSLPEVGHSRMDQYFLGDPVLSFEIPPEVNAEIPYTFISCKARCEGDAMCVGWSYIYPADTLAYQPALCELYDTADDLAESGRGASFSGYGPKAVELGLARPFDGFD